MIKNFLFDLQLEEDVHDNNLQNFTLTVSCCNHSTLRTFTGSSKTSLEPK